ncbi:thiamine phosphate synthase [Photobacterium lucens]|uniref:thiamine phosphate synthase n=1 Tax=Photobacterium lucens TaxID=2562949 RepID=UPI00136CC99B|nr:thiamine phosphate synthase [Photobacterium lucens]MBP2700815.1 thiamine phosphate synthase [Vibrio parahaemolyticus]MZG56077.1 thiamine phosphate synthase [Photobacterium lucens]MZG79537.1 thiamine phosphate synthase [Photobacterium lucens]
MSTLSLPKALSPLVMHIEPLLATAAEYQLGEQVMLMPSSQAWVEVATPSKTKRVGFEQAFSTVSIDYAIQDQWISSDMDLSQIKAKVQARPDLVVCGLPVNGGYLDIWHHDGDVRGCFSVECGDQTQQRAMLLAALALNYPLEDALVLARAYAQSTQMGQWPIERDTFPDIICTNFPKLSAIDWQDQCQPVEAFAPVDSEKLKLYPVVDSIQWVKQLLELDVKMTQLRIKDSNAQDLEQDIAHAIALGQQANAQVFINDYWQLAIEHGAFGVHLGQEDLAVADLNAIQQANLRLGISTHGYYEILRAMAFNPSYIALGHIYPTTTKQMPSLPQGVHRLKLYQQLIGNAFPTVAIGGIDLSRVPVVWDTGVSSVAVVRAITQSSEPAIAVEQLNQCLSEREVMYDN